MTDQSRPPPAPSFRLGALPRRVVSRVGSVGAQARLARQEELTGAGWTGSMFDPVHAFSLTDEAFLTLIRVAAPKLDDTRRAEQAEEVRAALELHDREGWTRDPASYHVSPTAPTTRIYAHRARWEFHRFPSSYVVPPGEPGAERWQARERNLKAIMRIRRVPGDRPWLVLVHGAGMGSTRTDMRIFDTERLAEQLDVNLLMPVLPLYGRRRAPGGLLADTLPSLDPLDGLHGLAQAIHDVRSCLEWVRARSQAPIGLYGMSLGGFTVSSVTALEPELDAVVAGMPLVDVAGVMTGNERPKVRQTKWFADFADDVQRLQSVVTPVALPVPQTPMDRLAIYAGVADRVVPAATHAALLSQHWGGVPIRWIRMSHTSHVMSRVAREMVVTTMRRHLLTAPRRDS